jgi:phosphopantothenoylcysteine decarboxylase/phosphopantothenate--cysteine ligase
MIKRILVAAGPTREKIDPVRFISNYSTGTFGYAIAKEARRRGLTVTLVSGPTALKAPAGVKFVPVESSLDMRKAVLANFGRCDCVVMSAAVADWRPVYSARKKIKKSPKKTIELVQNPDILAELGSRKNGKVAVGFALETENLEKNALKKLKDKNLDLIVANRLGKGSELFGDKAIDVVTIDKFGNRARLRGKSKQELARIILGKALKLGTSYES